MTIIILLDKVYHNCDSDPRVCRTINFFLKQNYSVKLISFEEPSMDKLEIKEGIEIHRIIPKNISVPRYSRIITRRIAKKIFKEYDYDIVLSNDHVMLNILSKLKRHSKSKLYLHDSHEFFQDYRLSFNQTDSRMYKIKSKLWRKIETYLERKNAQKVDYWITVCESLATKFDEIMKLENKSIVVRNIPNFNNCNRLSLKKDELEIYKKLESLKRTFNIIYFGNYFKCDSGLESVFKALQHMDSSFKLILLGTDKSGNYFDQLIEDLHLKDQVFKIGRISHQLMPEVASYCKIGVIPTTGTDSLSRFYSLPNKLLECVSLGLPIICTRLPEHLKLMKSSGSTLFVDYSNSKNTINQIVEGINEIQSNYKYFKNNALKMSKSISSKIEYNNAFRFLSNY